VAISFTVETDGQLPGGVPLAQAITAVDASAAPDYFLVNCAHPARIEPGLAGPGRWRDRILGMRDNASAKNHAELDEATELHAGDPDLLATAYQGLKPCCPRCRSWAAAAGPTYATSQPSGAPARRQPPKTSVTPACDR
jgi:homocysteine S-methyltransferase